MIGGEGRRGGEKQRKEMERGRGTAAIGHKRGRREGGRERGREEIGRLGEGGGRGTAAISPCDCIACTPTLEKVLPYSCLLVSVCRLVTVTGTKESVCKAFDAIGKKIDQVSFIWNMSCIHH